MMRRKSDLSRYSRKVRTKRKSRANRTAEEIELIREKARLRAAKIRAEETAEQRENRLEKQRLRLRRVRSQQKSTIRSLQRRQLLCAVQSFEQTNVREATELTEAQQCVEHNQNGFEHIKIEPEDPWVFDYFNEDQICDENNIQIKTETNIDEQTSACNI